MTTSGIKGSGLEWFVRRGSAIRGPFSSTRVRHFVLEGKLGLDDEVSADKIDWRRLGGVPEVVPMQMRSDDAGLAVDQGVARRAEHARAIRAIIVVALVVVVVMTGVTLLGPSEGPDQRDCTAPPAPGLLLEGCRLSGVQMRAAVLTHARMANVMLAGANLAESDLSGADLRYADLSSADLSYARLVGVDLKGANLRLADLTNADLSGADLSFADMSRARLGGTTLDGALLNGAIWTDGRHCGAGDCPR